jgi:hypothetical protein
MMYVSTPLVKPKELVLTIMNTPRISCEGCRFTKKFLEIE